MSFSKGEIVSFGRPMGQKTRGRIVRVGPTKAVVEILEARGRASPVGAKYRVPFSMIYAESLASSQRRQREEEPSSRRGEIGRSPRRGPSPRKPRGIGPDMVEGLISEVMSMAMLEDEAQLADRAQVTMHEWRRIRGILATHTESQVMRFLESVAEGASAARARRAAGI